MKSIGSVRDKKLFNMKKSKKSKIEVKRRSVTRKSGFGVSNKGFSGKFKKTPIHTSYVLFKKSILEFNFPLENSFIESDYFSFGGYFHSNNPNSLNFTLENYKSTKKHFIHTKFDGWNKFGGIISIKELDNIKNLTLQIESLEKVEISFYNVNSGVVNQKYVSALTRNYENFDLINNLYLYSPETNTQTEGQDQLIPKCLTDDISLIKNYYEINLKSCNRCLRFLPIRLDKENEHLSFSNHCSSPTKQPCSHGGFGVLKNEEGHDVNLVFGFQLECRLCKKAFVNTPLNPLRTPGQMKEDGQRRRYFEDLCSEILNKNITQFREKLGEDLSSYIWKKFEGKCFKCKKLVSEKEMHLDHTRPLSYLWPLDETATCLCGNCNSSKSDIFPVDFYDEDELVSLSKITNISIEELKSKDPNFEILDFLQSNPSYLFEKFLSRSTYLTIKDSKFTPDLIIKSLNRLMEEYEFNGQSLGDFYFDNYRPILLKLIKNSKNLS